MHAVNIHRFNVIVLLLFKGTVITTMAKVHNDVLSSRNCNVLPSAKEETLASGNAMNVAVNTDEEIMKSSCITTNNNNSTDIQQVAGNVLDGVKFTDKHGDKNQTNSGFKGSEKDQSQVKTLDKVRHHHSSPSVNNTEPSKSPVRHVNQNRVVGDHSDQLLTDKRALLATHTVFSSSTPIMSTSSSEGEPVLSSASAIMSRHGKKKKKWYKRLGIQVKKSLSISRDFNRKEISRSVENLTYISMEQGNTASIDHANSLVNLSSQRRTTVPALSMNSRFTSDFIIESRSLPISPELFHRSKFEHDRSLLDSDMSSDMDSPPSVSTEDLLDQEYDFTAAPTSASYRIIDVVSDNMEHVQELTLRQRQQSLMQHSFFMLDIWLKEGKDLVVRDSCGTSDPYVKFKIGKQQLYKSKTIHKNLNPQWDERFSIPIEDVYRPLTAKVYDYDRGVSDDPMGSADIELTTLEPNVATDLKLTLSDTTGKEAYMGYLNVQCTLIPKTISEKEASMSFKGQKSFKKGSMKAAIAQKRWSGIVTIILVEGHDLVPMDDNGYSDPYVKFRLGTEKCKSKVKNRTLHPRWLEQFEMSLAEDQNKTLEITVFDHDMAGKDDFMGRAVIDLGSLAHEKTHTIDQPLEDGAGVIKVLITITAISGTETVSDLANYTVNPQERKDVIDRYSIKNTFKSIKDVGWLQVKVFRAHGLASADIGGKSDPFCVLELVNSRLQTQTEYKTLNPEWNKVFTFNVKDIHSLLEVTVYDEDRDKKVEFLGKVSIPLLNIKRGERRWYTLKDKKLARRGKGAILMELDFVFNHVRAAIRTVNPKEDKYIQPDLKFKISVMKRNIDRVSKIAESMIEGGKFMQSCFDWESKGRSISAFIGFLVAVWTFELYMIPISLLLVFISQFFIVTIMNALAVNPTLGDGQVYADSDDEDEEEEKDTKKKEEKKSFKEKLQAIQEVCLQVQQGMDMAASLGERVKNTFNWTVPWMSMLACTALTIGIFVLYYIPIRYLIMAWGINKFTKKLRAPNAIPNNELMDYLSRIPSDSELGMYREFKPDIPLLAKKKSA